MVIRVVEVIRKEWRGNNKAAQQRQTQDAC